MAIGVFYKDMAGFDDKKIDIDIQLFFLKKMQFTYIEDIMDVQATGEAFSPQKRKSSPSNCEIS
jgi:hypothetical protein